MGAGVRGTWLGRVGRAVAHVRLARLACISCCEGGHAEWRSALPPDFLLACCAGRGAEVLLQCMLGHLAQAGFDFDQSPPASAGSSQEAEPEGETRP